MIEGQPHITALIQGCQPTMNQAGAGAEGTGRAMAKGRPFNCVRGQGRLKLDECLTRFLDGHPVCARYCGCSLGKRAVEKMNNGEIEMPKKFKKGDCGCGKQGVQLDGEGRCYVCREEARRSAQKAARMTPAASEDDTPPVAPAEAAPSIQAVQGGCPAFEPHAKINFPNTEAGHELVEHHGRLLVAENATREPADLQDDPDLSDDPDLPDAGYAPGVTAVVETLPPEGQLVGDEDHAPDACQGWPETAGTLVIDGMEFEAFTATRSKSSPTPLLSVQSGKVFSFNTGAIETFGLARFAFVELFVSADRKSVAFKFSEDSPASGRGVRATDSKDRLRKRIGAQGFMVAFGLDLKGKGPWPLEQPMPGMLVARVG